MAISIGATVTGDANAVTNDQTFSHTVDSGSDLLIVLIGRRFNNSLSSVGAVTWNTSESLTKLTSSEATYSNYFGTEVWYLVNPTATTANILVDHALTGMRTSAVAVNLSGTDTTTPITGTATATGTTNASNAVSSATGDLVMDVICSQTDPTVGSGQTERGNADAAQFLTVSSEAGATSVTMDWTGNGNYAWTGFSVNAASGGSGPSDPTTVTASNATLTTIDLSWADPNDPDVPIRAYYKAAASSTWLLAATLPAGTTSYTFTELTADTSYHVGVAAWDSPDESAIVYVTQATVDPVKELTSVTAGSPSHVSIPITWVDPNSPSYPIKVYYRTPAGSGEWTYLTTVIAGSPGATVGGLSAETQYDVGGAPFNDPYEADVVYDTATTTAAPAPGDLEGQPRCSITITFGF